jgi:16S rRNA (guanine527-N7)-methyltransferase
VKQPIQYGYREFQRDTSVSRETLDQFKIYADTLLTWNKKINLIGGSTEQDIWHRHFLDSAQIYPLISPNSQSLIDIGTGAGFPGMVLALLGCENVHLVESDHRKSAFLREAARLSGANVKIHTVRMEEISPFPVSTITARAVASINDLLGLAEPFLTSDVLCVFLKGRNVEVELTEAHNIWETEVSRRPSRTDPDSTVVCMREVRRVKSSRS